MLICIEGPDHSGVNKYYGELKNQFANNTAETNCYSDIFFYDVTNGGSTPNNFMPDPGYIIFDMASRLTTLMEISALNKNFKCIIHGGPLSLIAEAIRRDDLQLAKKMSMIFSELHYQYVTVISVVDPNNRGGDHYSEYDLYCGISHRHMGVMCDTNKNNVYMMFINKNNEQSDKLFVEDVRGLINK